MSEVPKPSRRSTRLKVGALLTAGALTAATTADKSIGHENPVVEKAAVQEVVLTPPSPPVTTMPPTTVPNTTTPNTLPEKRPPSPEEYPQSLKRPDDTLPVPGPGSNGVSETVPISPPTNSIDPEIPTTVTTIPETPEELAAREERSKEIMDKALERAYPILAQYPMDHLNGDPPNNTNGA